MPLMPLSPAVMLPDEPRGWRMAGAWRAVSPYVARPVTRPSALMRMTHTGALMVDTRRPRWYTSFTVASGPAM